MKITRTTSGYSLVEVLIAVTILLLAIAGPMTIASKGLQSSFFARDQLTAYMLAQEGIELFIAQRNEDVTYELNQSTPNLSKSNMWNWFNHSGFDPCKETYGCNMVFDDYSPIDETKIESCQTEENCRLRYDNSAGQRWRYQLTSGDPSPFIRMITIEELDPDETLQISSTVKWTPLIFSGTEKEVTLTTILYNIYAQP